MESPAVLIITEPKIWATPTVKISLKNTGRFLKSLNKNAPVTDVKTAPKVITGFIAYPLKILPKISEVKATIPLIKGPNIIPERKSGVFSKENLMVSPTGIFRNLPKMMLNAVKKAHITRVLTERKFCIKKSPIKK